MDLVVAECHINEELPAYLSPKRDNDLFMMKGQKGLRCNIRSGDSCLLDTCLLGREGLAGGFSAVVEDPEDDDWGEHEIIFVDFDERTGRVFIVTDGGTWRDSDAARICLADLPP